MDEIWKDIPGYENKYQVSNLGNVRSLNYKRSGNTQLLKLNKTTKGYPDITLSKNSKVKTHMIHRLVANAFIPNPNNLPEVNHIDENKNNNCVDNLEWVTSKENANWGTRNQRVIQKNRKIVKQYTKDGLHINTFYGTNNAEQITGIHHISDCCNGKCKTAGGYIWKYL